MEMTLPVSTPPSGESIGLMICPTALRLLQNWQCNIYMKSLGKYIKISNSGGNIALSIPGNKGVDLRLSGQKVSAPALVILTEAWIQSGRKN